MRFVDDDRVVATQVSVPLHLGKQDPIGHHLDQSAGTGMIGEADLIAHCRPQLGVQLLGDAFGH